MREDSSATDQNSKGHLLCYMLRRPKVGCIRRWLIQWLRVTTKSSGSLHFPALSSLGVHRASSWLPSGFQENYCTSGHDNAQRRGSGLFLLGHVFSAVKTWLPKDPRVIGQNCVICVSLVQWLAGGRGAPRWVWTNHDSP